VGPLWHHEASSKVETFAATHSTITLGGKYKFAATAQRLVEFTIRGHSSDGNIICAAAPQHGRSAPSWGMRFFGSTVPRCGNCHSTIHHCLLTLGASLNWVMRETEYLRCRQSCQRCAYDPRNRTQRKFTRDRLDNQAQWLSGPFRCACGVGQHRAPRHAVLQSTLAKTPLVRMNAEACKTHWPNGS